MASDRYDVVEAIAELTGALPQLAGRFDKKYGPSAKLALHPDTWAEFAAVLGPGTEPGARIILKPQLALHTAVIYREPSALLPEGEIARVAWSLADYMRLPVGAPRR